MTLRDLMDNGVMIQGCIKLQCWKANMDYPVIYFEGFIDNGLKPIEKYLERDITYIFPYETYIGGVSVPSICIEIEEE